MPLYSWLLSSLLVSQIGGNPSPGVAAAPPATVPAATYPAAPASGGAPIRQPAPAVVVGPDAATPSAAPARVVQAPVPPLRATTPQLVADALTLPPGGTITGRPVSLASVVATAPERQRQIEAVHAYWRLAEALGEYHFSHERQQRLARLRAANDEAADLRTAGAIAAAQVREAEVQVATAQHDLAEILLLAPGTPLPLPADQPLVGPYRTLFAELFAGKMAPQRARMLDQTLPLRNRAIESHAAALLAAEDALDAAIELQTSGQGRLAGVIAALDAQVRQQRAFLSAVCRYNHDIADYALVVISPQTTPEILVGTLIKPNRPAAGTMYPWSAVTPLPTTATRPAAYQQPISGSVGVPPASSSVGILPASSSVGVPPASGSVGILPVVPNRPTRAARPGGAAGHSPDAAKPANTEETAPADSPSAIVPPNPPQNGESQEPRLAPPQEMAIPLVPEQPAGPTTHSSRKPITASGPPQASAVEAYPTLVGLTPAEQTVKLAAALFSDRNLPSSAGQPLPLNAGETPTLLDAGKMPALRLIDCLRSAPTSNRAKAIEAYWTARQIAAQHQSFVEQIQWLKALEPTLSAQNPPLPMAMLQWRAARLAVEAERADAETDGRTALFELAGQAGLETVKTLPQPVSIPFVGRLPLPASPSDRPWPQRRLEATIPQRQQAIIDQAAAVAQSDASRAAATADFLAGRSSVERVLAAVEVQARETSAFLRAVTEYNRAIAQYATASLPTNTAAEKLVAALGAGSQ